MRIAVLGGTGLLGRSISGPLETRGHEVALHGRSTPQPVDMATGDGLAQALEGANVVLHLASDPRSPQDVDVAGTRRLVETLRSGHLVYMSIVGVDRHPFPYYRAKHEAEQIITDSDVPHTIVRATQFHDFVAFLMSKMCRDRIAIVPRGWVTQPIDTGEVVDALVEVIETRPAGLQPDLAGPEVLKVDHLARSYMTARSREAPVLQIPVPGKASKAFREGLHTNPERAIGTWTWQQYLEE